MPLIYFPEDRVTGCAGTAVGQTSVSSTHTTNPRQVEKKKNIFPGHEGRYGPQKSIY